jgi:hypothetical protein
MPRVSNYIDHRQALNIQRATDHAARIGRTLNTAIHLNVGHMRCEEDQISAMFERLRDRHFTKWLRDIAQRKNRPDWLPACYVWSIEGTRGYPNIHWLVHIPPALKTKFEAKLKKWLQRLAGPLNMDQRPVVVGPADEPKGATLYLLKGLDPRYAKLLKIRVKPQGPVSGKRAGMSVSLGPAARARYVVRALPTSESQVGTRGARKRH